MREPTNHQDQKILSREGIFTRRIPLWRPFRLRGCRSIGRKTLQKWLSRRDVQSAGLQSALMISQICCFSTDFCKCQCCGLTRNKNVKLGYSAFLLIALILFFSIKGVFKGASTDTIASFRCSQAADAEECLEERLGQILFISLSYFHLVLSACLLCKNENVKVINEGAWLLKLLLISAFVLLIWSLTGTPFIEYLWVANGWTPICLFFFQNIVFIDLLYSLDSYLNELIKSNIKMNILKASLTAACFGVTVFLCVVSFDRNDFSVCMVNAIALGIFIFVALLRVFPSNSLFICVAVMLYANCAGFSIPLTTQQQPIGVFRLLILLFLLIGMICSGSNSLRTQRSSLSELFALNTTKQDEDNRYVSSVKWVAYHCAMAIIVFSLPQVVCLGEDESLGWSVSNMAWWSTIYGLYLWSLLVSKVFPEKDFSDLQNYFKEFELN